VRIRLWLCGVAIAALTPNVVQSNQAAEGSLTADSGARLLPTSHPRLPRDLSLLWLAPGGDAAAPPSASREFAVALKLVSRREYTKALAMLGQPAMQDGPLGLYAELLAGRIEQELGRHAQAVKTFQEIQGRRPIGYLSEAAALGEGESLEALNDYDRALDVYERLAAVKTTVPDEVLIRVGRAAKYAGQLQKAGEAFARVYYEFPLGDWAGTAGAELLLLPNIQPVARDTQRYKLELGRAQRLYAARQFTEARSAYEKLKAVAEGGENQLVQLRLAQCDYFLKRYRAARDGLRPHLEDGARRAEALYFHALTMKALGDRATYERTIRRVADEFPTESWAEEALNNLATEHILRDQDAQADQVFRELYAKYPRAVHSERAAWKVGWVSYRNRRYDETVQFFERAAADFPRSDYRPAWLYWSGRAHEALGRNVLADDRYLLTTADYLNTYYGRLAATRLKGRRAPPRIMAARGEGPVATPSLLPPPPNEPIVRALLDVDAYELALNEIRYAQRAWGDSPSLQATQAWIFWKQGQTESGSPRFNLLRGSITVMKRAYPQYMAAGGEELPREILTAVFPLEYWDLIKKYSAPNKLDPYLVAALMAQESTFVRDIRSHAGAYGLMQLKPSTARVYARRLKIAYSSSLLTNADANVRIGTAYLADKIEEFGGLHLALASYNAGERAVRRWMLERPGLDDRAEFIEDIPYPETQNYVKKLLGTAEDYRRLYAQN
jgi:soluble lytic murein transglycosylase